MTWSILAITFYIMWLTQTGNLQDVRPVIQYYDNKHECDIREWWRVSDNEYIADCNWFYLYFDTRNLKWERKWNTELLFNICEIWNTL